MAKCCGLEQPNNRGTGTKVRWGRVNEKLRGNSGGPELDPQIKQEITYILNEIENTDDRNSIYMSSFVEGKA